MSLYARITPLPWTCAAHPHTGVPWSGQRRACSGHFYGYERVLKKLTPDQVTARDENVTVDLLV